MKRIIIFLSVALTVLALMVAGVFYYASRPATQLRFVNDLLATQYPGSSVKHVQLRLFSGELTLEGLSLQDPAYQIDIHNAQATLSLWDAALRRTITLPRLAVNDITVTLKPAPAAIAPTPQPALPATTATPAPPATTPAAPPARPAPSPAAEKPSKPWHLNIGTITANGTLHLAPERSATFSINLDQWRTDQEGRLALDVDFRDLNPDSPVDHMTLTGQLTARPNALGIPRAFNLQAQLTADGPSLPETAALALNADGRDLNTQPAFTLLLADPAQPKNPYLNIKATWLEENQALSGRTRIAFNDHQLTPFLLGYTLPSFSLRGEGDWATRSHFSGLARLDASLQLTLDHLARLDTRLADIPALELNLVSQLSSQAESIAIQALNLTIAPAKATPFLSLSTHQPFTVNLRSSTPVIESGPGPLLALVFANLPVELFQAFIPDLGLTDGQLNGALALAQSDAGTIRLTTEQPLTLQARQIRWDNQAWLDQVTLAVSPEGFLRETGGEITLQASITDSSGAPLLNADPKATWAGTGDGLKWTSSGNLQVALAALRLQPAWQSLLAELPNRPFQIQLDWDSRGQPKQLNLDQAQLRLTAGKNTPLSIKLLQSLAFPDYDFGQWRNVLPNANLFNIDFQEFPLALLNLLPFEGNAAGQITEGQLTVARQSDSIRLQTRQPITLQQVRYTQGDQRMLHNLSGSFNPEVHYSDTGTLNLRLTEINLLARNRPALSGELRAIIAADAADTLPTLDFNLKADLGALMIQPLLDPYYNLSSGNASVKGNFNPADGGAFKLEAQVTNLSVNQPAGRIDNLEFNAVGHLRPNDSTAGKAPLHIRGERGTTAAELRWQATARNGVWTGDATVDGPQLITDDLTLLAAAFRNPVTTAAAAASPATPVSATPTAPQPARTATTAPVASAPAPATTTAEPLTAPLWANYQGKVNLNFKSIIHGNYGFQDIKAELLSEPNQLSLQNVGGFFAQAPLTGEARLQFRPKQANHYQLTGAFDMQRFDLGRFLAASQPGGKPVIEGLFTMQAKFNGVAPSPETLADTITGTFSLEGKNGVLRVLDAAGEQGQQVEVISSVVAGLLGNRVREVRSADTVVQQLRAIPYQQISLKAKRDSHFNISLEEMLLMSETIILTGKGGIRYVENVPVSEQPLNIDAKLFVKGNLANALNDFRLLTGQANEQGYYPGPTFKVDNTLANPRNNLIQMITGAATRAVGSSLLNR